jgi:hypothetical protein
MYGLVGRQLACGSGGGSIAELDGKLGRLVR